MSEAQTPRERPFLVDHRRLEETPTRFSPSTRLVVTSNLRTSGLLSLLTERQSKLLLTLLTFTSSNGQVQATSRQMAKALGIPTPVMATWLYVFSFKRFHGYHLIYRIRRDEGHAIYAISRHFIDHEHQAPHEDKPQVLDAAPRSQVIAASRAQFTRPRAEVEKVVMDQLGHAVEELLDTPEGMVYRRLHVLRIDKEDIKALISTYGVERILQQLDWLPKRQAKNPARFLIAAIKQNFAPPKELREALGIDGRRETPNESNQDTTA